MYIKIGCGTSEFKEVNLDSKKTKQSAEQRTGIRVQDDLSEERSCRYIIGGSERKSRYEKGDL